jgi:class 3 adenylate cyclase/tetratricopeptide (TPR) repeat protein
MSSDEIEQIKAAIAALEAQRPVLGDAVVETALAPLREKLNALTRTAPTADERKRITVLFSDLAGFTATSETMDPEEVHAIMDAYFSHMSPVITQYGGTIEKYIGDAVMALFGAPKALENHEEMAVRAALGMQEALGAFNQELEQEHGVRLAMRIGVNTGLVLFGSMGGRVDGDFAAVGDTINLTSRLESAAPVGGILISAETARSLHAIFDFEPPQQISVKGKREPITVYVVSGERARRGRVRGVAGLHAPMVGRDAELAVLQAAFERALSNQCWQVAALIGEAGIGKSRLQREFVAWVAQARPQTHALTGRCYAHTQGTPYYLIADLMRGLFNLGGDVGPAEALNQVSEALRVLDPAADEAEFSYRLGSLASVLGFPLDDDPLQALEPEQRRDRTFLSLEQVLSAASAAAPLLVVVDDLHWADALSLSFVERIVQMAGRGPICEQSALLLAISRPADEPESALGSTLRQMAQPPHQTLTLSPLDGQCTDTLIGELVGRAALPPDLISLVLQHAQGNPFFVEEIIRSLIEDGTLTHDQETNEWRVTRDIDDVDVPDTVQGVLAARLDRLPGTDKRIVQHAAIIGRTFWQNLLADAAVGSGGYKAQAIDGVLSRLEQRQLIQRSSESHIADDWEWIFQHVLAQEVAYASVTKEVRRRVHVRVARWLEDHLGEQTTALVPMVAYHYERGGIAHKALEYLQQAGEQAAAQFANESAVDYFSRALALLEQADPEDSESQERRYDLLLGREGVYGLTGQRDAQVADLTELKTLADAMGDDRHRAKVALRHSVYCEETSDFPTSLKAAKEAIQRAEHANDPHRETMGLIRWGIALWRQGSLEEAHGRLEEALALARQHGDQPSEATSLHHLGTVSYFQGNYQDAREQLERALAIRRDLGDRHGETLCLNNLVAIYDGLGDYARGQACSEQALTVCQTIGDRSGEAYALGNLAANHYALGDLDAARDLHTRSLPLRQAVGDRGGEALALENLCLVLCDLDDYGAARERCARALEIEREIGDRQGEGYSLTYLALALEGLGELDAAAATYEEALRLRREIGQEALAIDDLAGLARVALKQSRASQASAYVEEALAWIADHGVHGIEYPLRIYLTAADVLIAAGQEERATEALAAAQTLIQEQATRISDETTRQAFLENAPLHRQIRDRISRLGK